MAVSLGQELALLIEKQVASGNYTTASEVVCDALRLLNEHLVLIDQLESKIDRGLDDAAAGRTYGPEEARALLRERRAARAMPAK